ncbi:hypothetical protein CAPTEDRAFT_207176 [Capitella teleta]|uniref:tRNA(His) guanylyltransferase n=1 Tax=Capitella teleta TaxID=283909 RepID=R7TCU9_CAPTE|nr:hypothetical protein CAPTEDRAFT_207176 [Capitella teleta]|eukprot:ELT89302.1 hypothetical protein CAPTEDRAFT_207176 [Capitella teleta]
MKLLTPNCVIRQIIRGFASMAKSNFAYVRQFETEDRCLPNTWIVVRVDGKGFHKFSEKHNFTKPNDERALSLMNKSAERVMNDFSDVIIAYGQSDEYSFVFRKNTSAYNRRASKLMTNICSLFASSYVFHWTEFFPDLPLLYPPSFDARVVLYPTEQNLRDYLSWRQADCHINNLYNTVFWALVQGGLTPKDAHLRAKGDSSEKNEILFTEFGINYNNLPEIFRKGSVLLKQKVKETCVKELKGETAESSPYERTVTQIHALHRDIIKRAFWDEYPHLLSNK